MEASQASKLALKQKYYYKIKKKNKTIQDIIDDTTGQLQEFAEEFEKENKKDDGKKLLPPKLFVVVSLWSKVVWVLDVSRGK